MKHSRLFLLLGSLLFPRLAVAQDGVASAATSSSPYVGNRALGEGAGVRTGNVEWHPGVAVEAGLDTNYLQRASSAVEAANFGPPVSSLRFRVAPQLSVRTADRAAESGGDEREVPRPVVEFDALAFASYNEFVALKKGYGQDFSALRNVQGGGGLNLKFLPGRPWSAVASAGYSYIAEPSNQGGLGAQYNRHVLNVGAKLDWTPGAGRFDWTILSYDTGFTLFDESQAFGLYDRGLHTFGTRGSWRFLPKTALLYNAKLAVIQYTGSELNDGETLETSLGVNGLLTKRLGLLLTGGWASSFYKNQNGLARNYDGPIAHAEAKWYFNSDARLQEDSASVGATSLSIGYLRDYSPSYLGDFYLRNRGYLKSSFFFAGRVLSTLEGGVSRLNYPDYMASTGPQPGFGETRIDLLSFTEYRPIPTVGVNLQLRYDQNISKIADFSTFSDDFSFNRFRAILGARWFL